MAIAREKVSRPQPRSNDSGVRNCPSAERGPNEISAITHPATITMIGVRHDAVRSSSGAVADDIEQLRKRRGRSPRRKTGDI
jgi:hypothetical protein